jgi:RNA polymerase sigma-70 factor (ECF subfamily)
MTEAMNVPVGAGIEVRAVEPTFHGAYPELHRGAYRVAFRLLGNRDEAADVAQEACARAFARWSRVARYEDPAAWVTRVAANLAIDHWRRRRTAARYADRHTDPQGRFDDERIDLHRALAKLPRRQRQVVVLRFVADLPERAVASVLGCSVGSVKSHGARGLAALRATLTPEDE